MCCGCEAEVRRQRLAARHLGPGCVTGRCASAAKHANRGNSWFSYVWCFSKTEIGMGATCYQPEPWSLDIYEPQRGSVPKPNVVPRLRDYVGLACQHDGNPNGVATTFAHVSIIVCQLVSPA